MMIKLKTLTSFLKFQMEIILMKNKKQMIKNKKTIIEITPQNDIGTIIRTIGTRTEEIPQSIEFK